MKDDISKMMKGVQAQFDGFEQRMVDSFEGVQSLDLVGIKGELTSLWKQYRSCLFKKFHAFQLPIILMIEVVFYDI